MKISIHTGGNLWSRDVGAAKTRSERDDEQLSREPISSLAKKRAAAGGGLLSSANANLKNNNSVISKLSQDVCPSCSHLWPAAWPRCTTSTASSYQQHTEKCDWVATVHECVCAVYVCEGRKKNSNSERNTRRGRQFGGLGTLWDLINKGALTTLCHPATSADWRSEGGTSG